MSYIFSRMLEVHLDLTVARMERGGPAVMLLSGPPGAGKTSLAREAADRLEAPLFFYSGAPDKERDLLFDYDVEGGITYTRGPAWQAFDQTRAGGHAVLLIDEVDKTSPHFDAFLLRLLEDLRFLGPREAEVAADGSRLLIVLTSNGRRDLRPEVQRRCQRVHVPRPDKPRMRAIVQTLAPESPPELIELLVRVGDLMAMASKSEPELAPSPVELARCAEDLAELKAMPHGRDFVREVATSHLVKEGGPSLDDGCGPKIRKWDSALWKEAG